MHALRLYLLLVDHSVRRQLQYRFDMAMRLVGQTLITGIEFLGIWALFDRFGTLPGWGLAEVAVLYGIVNTGFGLSAMLGRSFDTFGGLVRSGGYDRLLLRPRSTLLQLFGAELCLRRVGNLVQGGVVLGWGLWSADVALSAIACLVLTGAIVGCACFFLGLWILQATTCFWTTEGLEAWNVLTHGGCTVASYPLICYARWLQRLLTWVLPIALVTWFPTLVLLGRSAEVWHALAPGGGILVLVVAVAAWQVGQRRYSSTGS